jgi:hypothetical protein
VITCPYCFTRTPPRHIAFRCAGPRHGHGCAPLRDETLARAQGRVAVLPPVFTVRRPGRRAACPACGNETGKRVCPSCHGALPPEYCAHPGRLVALIGGKGAGKSTYIGVLVHELMNRVGEELQASLVPCDDYTIRRYEEEFGRRLYGERLLLDSTLSADTAPRDPLVYLLTRTVRGRFRSRTGSLTLVLFDTAGEDLGSRDSVERHLRYLSAADAIIFLIDPLTLPGAEPSPGGGPRNGRRSGRGDRDAATTATDPLYVITRVTEMLQHSDGKRPVPVAIALSKIDALPAITGRSALHRARSGAGVLRLDDHEAVHEQVRGLLTEWEAGNIDRYVDQHYANYAYFGLSALGAPPAGNGIDQGGIRPYRVEDPLLWLLYRFKMLDGVRG